MEEQSLDTSCDEGPVTEVHEEEVKFVLSDDQIEESLLHVADILSDDELGSQEESEQSRKRRASRGLNQPDLKDEGIRTPRYKRRRKNRNRSDKSKMGVRPNYFVGIQVSNPEVHRAVRSLQEKIVRMQPALRSTVIPTSTLHITLAVAHLPDPAHVAKAADVLKESISVNREMYNNPPVRLTFSGVKTFGNQVLFADIEGGESLVRIAGLARTIEESFKESGLVMPSKKVFQPHLTMFKLSRDFKLKRKGVLKITPSLYSDDKSTQFGQQVVKAVQLLSMNKPKDASGYYYCSHEETFGVDYEESNDHSECCKKLPLSKQLPVAADGELESIAKSGADIRRHLHNSAVSDEGRQAPSTEDVIKMLLLVGAASIGAAFLLRSFSSSK